MQKYGSMTKKEAIAYLAAHDDLMRRRWIMSCIHYALKWEKVRTPERWKNMGQFHRNKIIRGWIYRRDIAMRKSYA